MNPKNTLRRKLGMIIAVSIGLGLLLSFMLFAVREVDQRRHAKIAEIKHQLDEDQIADQMSLKEFIDPFTGSKNTKA